MVDEDFADALAVIGFVFIQEDRRGVRQFARVPNRFLTEWVHDDGHEALFTWEFDLGEWCESRGWQIGAAETSFQILYPQYDVRLPREVEAVAGEVRRVEARMTGIDLTDPAA